MIGNDHILRVGQMSCGAHFPTFQDGQCVATIQLATHFHRAQGRSASSNFQDMVNQKLDRLYKEEIDFVKRNRKGKLRCSLTCQTGLKKEAKSRTV